MLSLLSPTESDLSDRQALADFASASQCQSTTVAPASTATGPTNRLALLRTRWQYKQAIAAARRAFAAGDLVGHHAQLSLAVTAARASRSMSFRPMLSLQSA